MCREYNFESVFVFRLLLICARADRRSSASNENKMATRIHRSNLTSMVRLHVAPVCKKCDCICMYVVSQDGSAQAAMWVSAVPCLAPRNRAANTFFLILISVRNSSARFEMKYLCMQTTGKSNVGCESVVRWRVVDTVCRVGHCRATIVSPFKRRSILSY